MTDESRDPPPHPAVKRAPFLTRPNKMWLKYDECARWATVSLRIVGVYRSCFRGTGCSARTPSRPQAQHVSLASVACCHQPSSSSSSALSFLEKIILFAIDSTVNNPKPDELSVSSVLIWMLGACNSEKGARNVTSAQCETL